jgi:hypothetical protein
MSRLVRLPMLGPAVFDEAWRGTMQMARDAGEDPAALIARAAERLGQWVSQTDGHEPLDDDEGLK